MKPGAFTQILIHLIFAVKNREAVLKKETRPRVFEYLSGVCSNLGHKSLIVNGYLDHVHLLFGLNPKVSISDTVHDVKRNSSLFINNEKLYPGKFLWQDGYGAFSYSRSQLDSIYKYIQNQEEHHRRKSFKEEYTEFLNKFQVEYDEKYIFNFFEIE